MSLPLLHADGAVDIPLLGLWNLNPLLLALLSGASVAYAWGVSEISRRQPSKPWPGSRIIAFYAGLAATALAFLGPLDTYNDESFFMHMAQHLVMIQVAAPLLLLGRPVHLALRAAPRPQAKAVLSAVLGRPAIRIALGALVSPLAVIGLFNLNLGAWHFPVLYNAALRSDLVHEVMHVSFFLTGLLFWWPIIDPIPRHHRFGTGLSLAAFGFAMLSGKIISGILISSSSLIYAYYQSREALWGMSPLTDQHLGGGLMLASGVAVYGGLFFLILIRALLNGTPETSLRRTPAHPPRRSTPPPVRASVPGEAEIAPATQRSRHTAD